MTGTYAPVAALVEARDVAREKARSHTDRADRLRRELVAAESSAAAYTELAEEYAEAIVVLMPAPATQPEEATA